MAGIRVTDLTAARLREFLSYDPATGLFTWLIAASRRVRVGDVAGATRADGYCVIRLEGRTYFAHRLAWLYMTGRWPDADIDHADVDPSNNAFDNLRQANRSENLANTGRPSTNVSGIKGASWDKRTGRFQAKIEVRGLQIHLGRFETAQEAGAAYAAAAKQHFGQFARAE